jgi:hypothetical protein
MGYTSQYENSGAVHSSVSQSYTERQNSNANPKRIGDLRVSQQKRNKLMETLESDWSSKFAHRIHTRELFGN